MMSKKSVYGVLKRGMDVFFGVLLLVLLAPLFLLVAIMIKLDSRGPVIFKQERTGRFGREFEIWKFRSMVAENDVRDASCGDKYTRIGKFLRRSSLDELPQLFNVVRGEMSFIGPRPWVVEYYKNMNERQRGRVAVRPGITGLAQVKGRNGISVFLRIEYDLLYVERFSFLQDLKVLVLTFLAIMTRRGAESDKARVMDDIGALKAGRA